MFAFNFQGAGTKWSPTILITSSLTRYQGSGRYKVLFIVSDAMDTAKIMCNSNCMGFPYGSDYLKLLCGCGLNLFQILLKVAP